MQLIKAKIVVVGVTALALFAGPVLAESFLRDGAPEIPSPTVVSMPQFAGIARVVSPAVVNISVEGGSEEEGAEEKNAAPPPFKKDQGPSSRSLGSGFIVSEEGLIVTSSHVVEKADKIVVRLLDDRTDYPAEVVGADPKSDIALLQIKPKKKLPTVYLGDSDALDVGEWVVAIGNQFELGQTVTAGIVSAKARRVALATSGPYDAFIQTDASINPGSSGGPLVNSRGQVVGINTAIFSPGRASFGSTGFNIGIGFAIPINFARDILRQLKESGKVTRGMLGVMIQNVTPEIAEALGLAERDGALVSDLISASPAEEAGIKRGDVIVSFAGKKISEHSELPMLVASTAIGTKAEVGLIRNGKPLTVTMKIEELTDPSSQTPEDKPEIDRLGIIGEPITEHLAKTLKLPSAKGVFVDSVAPGSFAMEAGVAAGEIIEELAGKPTNSPEELRKIADSLTPGKPVLVLVRRRPGTRFLTLKVE